MPFDPTHNVSLTAEPALFIRAQNRSSRHRDMGEAVRVSLRLFQRLERQNQRNRAARPSDQACG
ncbi:hypothetical protein MicloDRAFT_00040830 [Microvirga lotononidis]|uniref:Uncharacterized protein n=2 Tax=Microvirga lotononidis TaxID=864069 RepID=I4YU73_9HYPH|nr:hypothetical protein MicloDRAFT_00040830 [Microvirga lotononidis]